MNFFHHLYQFTSAAICFSTFDHIYDFVVFANGWPRLPPPAVCKGQPTLAIAHRLTSYPNFSDFLLISMFSWSLCAAFFIIFHHSMCRSIPSFSEVSVMLHDFHHLYPCGFRNCTAFFFILGLEPASPNP